jgi:Acyl-CoA synthetases (AMP-forming)/AMP-acid ligases II
LLLLDLLEKNAVECGDDVALIELNPIRDDAKNLKWKEYDLVESGHSAHYRAELTWREFDDMANRIANMLIDDGVKQGDKVAILLLNCIDWLPIYFGIMKTGAVVVPLNFRYTSEEIAHCIELAEASVLFFGYEFIERIEAIKNDPLMKNVREFFFVGMSTPDYARSFEKEMPMFPATRPAITSTIKPEDYGVIYYSSGTTGFPKAILHTHASIYSAAETELNHHGQTKDDVFLLIPPLYHTGAKMHWFGSLISGSKTVLLKGTDPGWVLHTAAAEKATIVWLLVPWARDVLEYFENNAEEIGALDFSRWRLMHIGAQPVPRSLIKRWLTHFPHHKYDTNYGLSESIGPGCVHLGLDNVHKVGSIGKAGYKWTARIVDENGTDVEKGSVGELIVSGPGLMTEYYRDPEATKETLKDGWLYTGDMAREDEDGFIYLVDRKKDVIISGGENIYPVQVEDFLTKFEPIKDAAIIGMSDERLGEIAVAIIEPKKGVLLTEDDVKVFLEELPRYKRPRRIIFDNVPRNATGKIEKPKLREKYNSDSIVAKQTEAF